MGARVWRAETFIMEGTLRTPWKGVAPWRVLAVKYRFADFQSNRSLIVMFGGTMRDVLKSFYLVIGVVKSSTIVKAYA